MEPEIPLMRIDVRVSFVIFLILFADIAELLCRGILVLFILFIVVFLLILFGGIGYKRRWILPRKFNTSLTAARPGMTCDQIPEIIRISGPDRFYLSG